MSIRDNGKGFDPEALLHDGGSHIGTSTMRERAAAIGGTLELISAPDKGTEVRVQVDVPFPPRLDAGGSGNGFAIPLPGRSLSANAAGIGG